jgi:hypothetical protein
MSTEWLKPTRLLRISRANFSEHPYGGVLFFASNLQLYMKNFKFIGIVVGVFILFIVLTLLAALGVISINLAMTIATVAIFGMYVARAIVTGKRTVGVVQQVNENLKKIESKELRNKYIVLLVLIFLVAIIPAIFWSFASWNASIFIPYAVISLIVCVVYTKIAFRKK